MTSKELKRLIRKAEQIRVIFHETYLPTTKKALLKVVAEYPNKNDWECNLEDGYLIVE